MKKIFAILILTFLLLPQSFVSADGMLISEVLGTLDLYETNQTALIVYNKGIEDLYIKINYEGNADDFAWIIPTPSKPKPEEAVDDIFNELYEISKPEIKNEGMGMGFWGNSLGGYSDGDVQVHSQGVAGVYDFAVLSAGSGNSLLAWLEKNNYKIPQEAKELIDWYLNKSWFFTAIKINKEEFYKRTHKDEKSSNYFYFNIKEHMHPIKLSFSSDVIVYPIKISRYSTLSPEKYIKMITDKYTEYKIENTDNMEIISKWLNDSREEIWQMIKDNIAYDKRLKYNDTIFQKGWIYMSTFDESDYNKYKNRWWKKNNTQQWLSNVANEIVNKDDRGELLKLRECKELEEYNFSKDKIVEDFQNQLIKDFEKVINFKFAIVDGRPVIRDPLLMEKILQARSNCGEIKGINTNIYSQVIKELEQDFPYYTEDGIKYDIQRIIQNALPHELQQMIWKNGKTNEVLVYVATDKKVKAPNFKLEYSGWLSNEELKKHEALKKILSDDMYLTKLRRHFAKSEMDDDVYFINEIDNNNFRLTITYSDGYINNGYDIKAEASPLSKSYGDSDYQAFFKQVRKNQASSAERVHWMILSFVGMGVISVVGFTISIFIKKRKKNIINKQKIINDEDKIQKE